MKTKYTILSVAKTLLAIGILWCIATSVQSYQHELATLSRIDWWWLSIALVAALGYRIANAHGWNLSLKSLGQTRPSRETLRIWLTSEACRWLPGSVWGYGSRAYQANKAGVPLVTASASLFLEIALTVLAWVTIAAVGFALQPEAFLQVVDWNIVRIVGIAGAIFGVFVGVTAFASKSIKGWVANRFERVAKQVQSLRQLKPNARQAFSTWAYYVGMCTLNGIAFCFVLNAVTADCSVPWIVVIAANAVAWLVGFFALFAPGGLVVREGTLALILAPWMPAEQAIAAAIVWRLVQIAAELACVVPAMLSRPSEGKCEADNRRYSLGLTDPTVR